MPFKSLAMARPGRAILCGAPEGLDVLAIADLSRRAAPRLLVHIARDGRRMRAISEALKFFAPDVKRLSFPAWDCLPYDRVSPAASVMAQRMAVLSRLAGGGESQSPRVLLTSVNAALQRTPPGSLFAGTLLVARPGKQVPMTDLRARLAANGFIETDTVAQPGDFAVRGGLIDIFPPGAGTPLRLDFFGDTLESIRRFDPQSQRGRTPVNGVVLRPANEVLLTPRTIAAFRTGYTSAFGGAPTDDPLYESVSAGRRFQGMEHWMALFYDRLETVFDYCSPDAPVSLDHLAGDAAKARLAQILDGYQARLAAQDQKRFGAPPYKPLEPEATYLTQDEWDKHLAKRFVAQLTPFEEPPPASLHGARVISLAGRQGRDFAAERARPGLNVYEAVKDHIAALISAGKRVLLASWSDGARDRLTAILRDHDLTSLADARSWPEAQKLPQKVAACVTLGIERGFETAEIAVIGEQDIVGDRLVRPIRRRKKRQDAILSELSSLSQGDLVVHADHGIGRFDGLKTITVQGAPHDCLSLTYHGNDRLFVPVENIDLLSRYGAGSDAVPLDRLGSSAWQARKARLKKQLLEIAAKLIRTAAARHLRPGDVVTAESGPYDEFCANFAYEETEDQLDAIHAVLNDLASGKPMDRLICGDVGFGKTEVALRAAFVCAMAGRQVAVVAPTTLLARQHFAAFSERFRGYPVRIGHVSRLVGRKEAAQTLQDLAQGQIDIIIGTHALLAQKVRFCRLGLLVIDEEQHFGVNHKERLKELATDVHVLTLTATPIPRTLQLALSDVKSLSLIATPPVDRLAVRSFISPFDPVVIREYLLREFYRGGQSFYVCPRISDLDEIAAFLGDHVPEIKFAVAHGRMPAQRLEDIMTGFYERRYDALLSTSIVESGLDIPSANTLIVHRADRFGLSQLYQLRGRVGRAKLRAYALFTIPANAALQGAADKRLQALQSLDTLGAGFSLASHDLDLRGAGNLLGKEQSGHVREVGFELYQSMLEEAVAQLREDDSAVAPDRNWSPQIALGTPVLIPESYIAELGLRLELYRRLAMVEDEAALNGLMAEIRDRFGPMPEEMTLLAQVVSIKLQCRKAGVAVVEAGPRGAVITFRDNGFARPERLIAWLAEEETNAKLRPDMKLVATRNWRDPQNRLKGVRNLIGALAELAGDG